MPERHQLMKNFVSYLTLKLIKEEIWSFIMILLKKSIQVIASTFKKRMAANLQNDRGALLLPQSQQPNYEKDFELITWLIIK